MRIFLFSLVMVASVAQASETRLLLTMPTSNKTTVGELTKAKKSGYICTPVKQGPKGNPQNVPGSKSLWFTDVVDTEADAADDAIANGKRAVRCQLKVWDKSKHRMANADLGDSAE